MTCLLVYSQRNFGQLEMNICKTCPINFIFLYFILNFVSRANAVAPREWLGINSHEGMVMLLGIFLLQNETLKSLKESERNVNCIKLRCKYSTHVS